MPTGVLSSDVSLGLPHVTPIDNSDMALNNLTQDLLNAFRIVQQELSAAKSRIAALEAYNTAHP